MHYFYAVNHFDYKNIYPHYFLKCHTVSHRFLHLPNVLYFPEYNLHVQCGLTVHLHFIITNSMEQSPSQTAHSSRATQENFCSTKNPNIHYHVYDSPSTYFFHIHITNILQPMPRSPLGTFLLSFLNNVWLCNAKKRPALIFALTFHSLKFIIQ